MEKISALFSRVMLKLTVLNSTVILLVFIIYSSIIYFYIDDNLFDTIDSAMVRAITDVGENNKGIFPSYRPQQPQNGKGKNIHIEEQRRKPPPLVDLRILIVAEDIDGRILLPEPNEKINLDDIIDLEDVNISKVIRSGKIELKINDGKQGKHIKGHNNYIEGRSYIIISSEEVQKLINKYAGTGMLIRTKNGKWAKQEVITTNTLIGYDVNDISGAETATKAFKIHYSNKGTHIVPKKE